MFNLTNKYYDFLFTCWNNIVLRFFGPIRRQLSFERKLFQVGSVVDKVVNEFAASLERDEAVEVQVTQNLLGNVDEPYVKFFKLQ